tara:strand:- start:241 stop:720 length:480 start_codon:yes stop_codon:yes gene_type:complete
MLDTGGAFLVCAIHHWASATSKNLDPFPCLIEGFRAANLLDEKSAAPIILDDVLSSLIVSLNDNPSNFFGSCKCIGQIEELVLIIIALYQSNENELAKRVLNVWIPKATARFISLNLKDLAYSLKKSGLKINLPITCLNTISYILNSRRQPYYNQLNIH